MPRTTIRRIALAGATSGAVVLAGCSAVSTTGDPTGTQATPLSSIVAERGWCAGYVSRTAGPVATRGVAGPQASCQTFSQDATGAGRLLVAVAVPDGAPDPTPVLVDRPAVPFAVEPAATSRAGTPPVGHHWVGYRSGTISFEPGDQDPGDVVRVAYPAPRSGEALATDEQVVRLAIGVQVSKDGQKGAYDPDRAVNCDERLEDSTPGADEDVSSTWCPQDTNAPRIDPTDARITAPQDAVEVQAGATATVPFAVEQIGTVGTAADLALSAATDAPGASVTPSATAVPWATPTAPEPPADGGPSPEVPVDDPGFDPTARTTTDAPSDASDARSGAARPEVPADDAPARRPVTTSAVPVSVAVPAGTPGGTYAVTLTASDAGGRRTGTARIRVTAAPAASAPTTPAPAPTPAVPATPRRPSVLDVKVLRSTAVSRRTRRLHLGRVTCARTKGSCTVRSKVRIGGRTIGSVRFKVLAGSSAGVTIRLTRKDLARLIARRATATTTVTAAGADPVVRTTRVRAKGRP